MTDDGCPIVVLVSGGGTNLQALIDAVENGAIPGRIVAVISNRPGVKGLERAIRAGIPAITLDHTRFDSREAFDAALIRAIDRSSPRLIALAGFMRILTPELVNHYAGRMLNIHPSRLPEYRGLHTHARVLEAGDARHGASIHFVTAELDGGPVVIQSSVPVHPGHTPETLASDILKTEHIIYPLSVRWFCEGRLRLTEDTVELDGNRLTSPLQLENVNGTETAAFTDSPTPAAQGHL